MLSCNKRLLCSVLASSASLALLFTLAAAPAHAQDDSKPKFERHGRKYKAPPQTSDIEVTVVKGFNQKPIEKAAVIFHPVDADGKDEGFLEMKTDSDGKAKIDVIPTGSKLRVQVIATGFTTYAEDYKITEPQRQITIKMQRPQEQVSTYVDQSGKASSIKAGVQEPMRPKLDKNGNPIPSSGQSSPTASNSGK